MELEDIAKNEEIVKEIENVRKHQNKVSYAVCLGYLAANLVGTGLCVWAGKNDFQNSFHVESDTAAYILSLPFTLIFSMAFNWVPSGFLVGGILNRYEERLQRKENEIRIRYAQHNIKRQEW